MFIKAGQSGTDYREHMRGGNGTAQIENHAAKAELPAKCRLLADIKLEQGASIGFHKHEGETEIFIIKSGIADIMDDETPLKACVGDVVITSSGHGHSVACASEETLVMTAVIILD